MDKHASYSSHICSFVLQQYGKTMPGAMPGDMFFKFSIVAPIRQYLLAPSAVGNLNINPVFLSPIILCAIGCSGRSSVSLVFF
jgi:hypothetical protein